MAEDGTTALLERAAGGNREAFAVLAGKYSDSIRRLAYMLLHSMSVAEDVVQETLFRALRHLGGYRGEGDPRSWFFAIALNICRKWQERANRQTLTDDPRLLERGTRPGFTPRGILTSVTRRESMRELTIALGYLTDPQREAFVLHYIEELPYERVGPLLGVTTGAAKSLAHRARQVLQTKLHHLKLW